MGILTGKDRAGLSPRREPYWHALGTGHHVGFRKVEDGGHWIARAYDAGTRTRAYKALGDLSHLVASEQFTAAVHAARAWFEHLGQGGRKETVRVADVCRHYVEHLRRKKGAAPAADAHGRFARFVYPDPVAAVEVAKLSSKHVQEWRTRLEARPATLARRGPRCRVKTAPVARARSAASINRDMAALRAALNLALRAGFVASAAAWRNELEPVANAGRRRTLYLTPEHRRALHDTLSPEIRLFVRGLCLLPLRPGALAALTVGDFDVRASTLTVHRDKAGNARTFVLPQASAKLLADMAKGKAANAPLFARADGRAWDKDAWKGPIKAAASAIGAPDATAYSFRHASITDMVANGNDLFTVAAMSGTSVTMIEKHYGHLRGDVTQRALASVDLWTTASTNS